MKPGDVKLSVSLITYNQKKYIKQAIEGVLQQKTNFAYELIIGDDCSADGTRDILINYQNKHPELIHLILHPKKNEGIPGKVNFLSTLNAATGKYIALLDGDDYWMDKNKLQKQVDFLEAHPGYAICCHRIYIKKDDQKPKLHKDEFMPSTEATYDIEMMAKLGNLVATPSVVYRNKLFSSLPAWFDQSPIGDYVLHMMNAQYGKIKYFPEPMAVYRQHSKGAWSGQSVMTNAANMIKVIGLLLTETFDERVKKGLRDQLKENKTIYLNELMREEWGRFTKEFNTMMEDDKTIAMALVEKMKIDMDAIQQSRTYTAIKKWKRIVKGR
jgi:glycosyltransferase involved in cell wall biosynthesis